MNIEEQDRINRAKKESYEYADQLTGAGQQANCAIPMAASQEYMDKRARDRLHDLFSYHPPRPDQLPKYQAIRTAARHLAEVIEQNVPSGMDQMNAIGNLRIVVMLSNADIALDGRS